VYALETLLLPEKAEEANKLLLTHAYKKRMVEAFESLMTKRRETHIRSIFFMELGAEMISRPARPPDAVMPRLRVEPCPSYFLRTARAYSFLANFLEAAVGKEALQGLQGLRENMHEIVIGSCGFHSRIIERAGENFEQNLYDELQFQRELFYGLYLVSAEDIGIKPELLPDEPLEIRQCYQTAKGWLGNAVTLPQRLLIGIQHNDKDLEMDTRVVVPIHVDLSRKEMRVWATLGVRLAKLDASYALPPSIKPIDGGKWTVAGNLDTANYLIPVDEFAEVAIPSTRPLTRDEFRAVCDRKKTKDAIVAELLKRR
jgi:hypothetical protein